MKIINDSVHGPIVLNRINWAFIDTPAFQRLRNISQLGMASWVYPTAGHHRFEHCLGTAHLAGRLVERIRKSQPELDVDDKDVECAELAGLLHDIGHGPFSHCWDADISPAIGVTYEHERASIEIIDWLLDQYNDGALRKELENKFGLTDDHIRIIKEMIYGILPGENEKYYKEGDPKSFLYDVVSNSFCGLDVDKLDYLARDGKALGTVSLHMGDIERLMLTATVVECEEDNKPCGYHVVWRDVTAPSIHNVFQLRHRLHCIAYKHKTTVCVQIMLTDAMTTDYLKQEFLKMYDLSDPSHPKLKIEEFLKLTDNIFWETISSDKKELKESRDILERISSRDLYPALCSLRLQGDDETNRNYDAKKIEKELCDLIDAEEIGDELKEKCKRSLIIKKCIFTFGSTTGKKKNPLDLLQYKNQSGGFIENSKNCYASFIFSPKLIIEVDIRLYSRCRNERSADGEKSASECNDVLKRVYRSWAKTKIGKDTLDY